MIIYNVTASVEESVTSDWLKWMKKKHVPEVMSSGIFISAQIKRVISEADTNNTFAVAYTCKSIKDLHRYKLDFSNKLQQKHIARYGEKVVVFRSIMEVLEKF